MNTHIQLPTTIARWINNHLDADKGSLVVQALSGDAGNRCYLRLSYTKNAHPLRRLLLISPNTRQAKKELARFCSLAKTWKKNNIATPSIYALHAEHTMAIIEDFGDMHLADILTDTCHNNHTNITTIYQSAIDLTTRIATQNIPNNRHFLSFYYPKESTIFAQWFPQVCPIQIQPSLNTQLAQKFYAIFSTMPQVTIHRDFHARNLMVRQTTQDTLHPNLGVLDFQDSCRFIYVYDAASLMYDAYTTLPSTLLSTLHEQCRAYWPTHNVARDIRLAAMQRLLKMCGIFARLAIRDNKPQFLQYLPKVAQQINTLHNELFALGDRQLAPFSELFTQIQQATTTIESSQCLSNTLRGTQ